MSDILITKDVIDEAINNSVDGNKQYKYTPYPFRPVKCLEEDIKKIAPANNYLYFTTDTKKIYFGQDNQFLPMCANTGFFYGLKEIQYDNSGVMPDPNVVFYFEEIEGEAIPEIDDLILNIDGCFYRVKEIMEDSVATTRLTLQGSGPSVGPGGGGGEVVSSFTVSRVGGKEHYFSLTADEAFISFRGNSTDTTNYIDHVWWTFARNPEVIMGDYYDLGHPMGETYRLDLKPYLSQFSATGNSITVNMEDKYGTPRSLEYKIYLVETKLEAVEPELLPALGTILKYNVKVSGGQNLTTKFIEYIIYDENQDQIIDTQTLELKPSDVGVQPMSIKLDKLQHGSYTLTVQIKGSVGSSHVASNIIRHKVLRQVEGYGALFDAYLPADIQQYNEIPISYLLVTDGVSSYPLQIQLGENKPIVTNVIANELGTYSMASIDKEGTYTLLLTLPDLNIQKQYTFTVNPYSGTLPVVNTSFANLELYLTAAGRSNDLQDRDQWESSSAAEGAVAYTAQLSDFYYGNINGWSVDDDGVTYLKLSQGAKMTLDNYHPFSADAMGSGMTIELDFRVSGVTDFDAELIKCYSTNQYGTITGGFAITGDQAKFYHSSKNTDESCVKFNLVENKRIRLTYKIESRSSNQFPMILSYINGIISNAEAYLQSDTIRDSDKKAVFQIDSTHGQVDLYSVKFYNMAIDEAMILTNYQASLPSKEERQASYESNLILDAEGNISLDLIEAENYNLQIPYAKITGGFGCNKEYQMKDSTKDKFALPVGKKDYRLIDIEVIYPRNNNYFKGYGELDANGQPTYQFKLQCDFGDPELNVTNAFNQTPEIGAMMYCQGTSSMEYPIKNLRVKMKGKKIKVRPDLDPVKLICFKADYMESSGSHNTGAANLIDSLYEGIDIATPGQQHFGAKGENIVTCIKGHPCLIFYSETGEKGSYKFIGKYNLNLDKGTPEPFGFKYSSEETDLEPTDKLTMEDIKYGYLLNEDGSIVLSDGKKENAIYCYEFLDNKVKVCNFLIDPDVGDSYHSTWYGSYYNKDEQKDMPGWTMGFESRYPEDRVGLNDADNLYELASWISELQVLRKQEEQAGKKPDQIQYFYDYYKATGAFSDTTVYYQKINETYSKIQLTAETYKPDVYFTRVERDHRFVMDSLERFKREYLTYFNKDFLISYYVITEALHMMDSRVKNMMIATWGKEQHTYLDLDDNEHTVYRWIWYPIFYDMDTMLGLNNQGKPQWNYDDDDANPAAFNGDDVLWDFVRDVLFKEINACYDDMEQSGGLTVSTILSSFNKNQASMANEAMYNQDCKYKYLDPYRNEYLDYSKDPPVAVKPGSMLYLYAAQGSRDLDREYYINNRISYLSGKRASTNYYKNPYNYITFRVNEPKVSDSYTDEKNEKIRKTLVAAPVSKTLEYTSLKTGYAGVLIGANGQLNNYRFDDVETKDVSCDTEGAGNTEAYLVGVDVLSNLGDLSACYPEKFIIGGAIDCRLKDLQLGNPHRDYYNEAWGRSDPIGLSNCIYLENLEMSNCSEYRQPLDLSQNKNLKKIRLTGSGVTSVTLPTGGIIEDLRLPLMQSLRINSHPELNNDGFTFGYYDYTIEDEIIPEKGHWVNDFSTLLELQITGTPNIDTYEIVRNAPQLDSYQLNDIAWNITDPDEWMYVLKGEAKDLKDNKDNITYYYINEQREHVIYSGDFNENDSTLLYAKSFLVENGQINEIPILEFLKTRNRVGDISHAAALTGTIIIDVPAAADEFNIFYKYNETYPGVTIEYGDSVEVDQAYTIQFYGSDEYSSGLIPISSKLTNGTLTWEEIVSDISDPVKKSSNEFHYSFSGIWQEVGGNEEQFIIANLLEQKPPERDLKLVPIFIATDRYYDITFYDNNGIKIEHLSTQLTYNITKSLEERLSDKPLYFLCQDYNGELEHGRLALKGWITKDDYDNKNPDPIFVDFKTKYVNNKGVLQFYAWMVEEDAREVATDIRCFEFITDTSGKHTFKIKDAYKTHRWVTGQEGTRAEAYERSWTGLKGRITLPNGFTGGGKQINTTSSDLFLCQNITHIYFAPDSNYQVIGQSTFRQAAGPIGHPNLIACYLPDTITTLENTAFANCKNLEIVSVTGTTLPNSITDIGDACFENTGKVKIIGLPSNLTNLGSNAFNGAGDGVIITELPLTLEWLKARTFQYCTNVNIIQFGVDQGPGLKYLDPVCLNGAGSTVNSITLLNSINVEGVSRQANAGYGIFQGYGKRPISVIAPYSFEEYKALLDVDGYADEVHWFGDNVKPGDYSWTTTI